MIRSVTVASEVKPAVRQRASYHRAYYQKNKARFRANQKRWRSKNPKRQAEWNREYDRVRLQDLNARMKKNLRTRIYLALHGINKSATTQNLLGCSIEHLRVHLEAQFTPEMSWENYGSYWHVDHKIPCAKYDLTDPNQQKACFHFSNLQPLEASENIRKSDKAA